MLDHRTRRRGSRAQKNAQKKIKNDKKKLQNSGTLGGETKMLHWKTIAALLWDRMNKAQFVAPLSNVKLCFESTIAFVLEVTFVLKSLFRLRLLYTLIRCRATVKHGSYACVYKPGDDSHAYRRKTFINKCFAPSSSHVSVSRLVLFKHCLASHVLCHRVIASAISALLSDSRIENSIRCTCLQCPYWRTVLRRSWAASDGYILDFLI